MLNRVAQSWRGASAHIRSLASKKFPASAESQPAGLADTGSATAPRLAIAHDYLTQRGGAERVVLALHRAFPEAPIYTTLYNPEGTFPEFENATIITSPLNRVGLLRRYHRLALPLLPLTASCLKVPAHVAVVSTTGWAHGFKFTGEKLVYCHSPARWLYLRDQYLGDEKKNSVIGVGLRVINPLLRFWDQRAAARSEHYVANSTAIQKRIARVYGKDVPIIFPPYCGGATRVEEPIAGLQEFTAAADYFLLVSRLMSYKNVDEAIEACNRAGKKLLIIGHGPEKDKLLKLSGPNVRIISGISDEQLCSAYRHCLALLAVSHEDFGITPLEAGASGKPVIAYRAGGYLDTIREGLNGVFIEQPTSEQIEAAIRKFNPEEWDKQAIKNYIARFSEERFIDEIRQAVDELTASSGK
ncbi:glycosyl transferase family 1 [Rothia sp. HMSC058E10]|uniref:glycosyltransferase n=1 Tax=Rothia sp. HMSC058E10 TaxID=1715088 RepID=UPI0008A1449D|nr:glycosyltransferase [Rothia sp. HMSC058E10]OFN15749.1 glycosyl transferase family 1 [Rothia sp. HMSC058E10]